MDCWLDRKSDFKRSLWTLGNCDCDCVLKTQLNNHENNKQIN